MFVRCVVSVRKGIEGPPGEAERPTEGVVQTSGWLCGLFVQKNLIIVYR